MALSTREGVILLVLGALGAIGYVALKHRSTADGILGTHPAPAVAFAPAPSVSPEDARLAELVEALDRERYEIEQSVSAEDLKKLFVHVKQRAEKGDPTWLARLADMYLYSLGTKDDLYRATIERAAKAGHPASQFHHAQFLQNDKTLPLAPMRRPPKPGAQGAQRQPLPYATIEWMEKAIAGGDVDAMLWLGGWYVGDERYDVGVPLIERAESLQEGEGCAKFALATLYLEGTGVTRDIERALMLLEASRGCANVGDKAIEILTDGKLVPKDYGRAVRILEAEGWMPFDIKAAGLYETGGPGLPKDIEKAKRIYLAAHSAGYAVKADLKRLGLKVETHSAKP